MKWFKHMTDMSSDVKVKRLIRKYGVDGYGLYNYILELIVRKLETESPLPDLEESSSDIAADLSMDTVRVEEIMWFCIQEGLFEQDAMTGRVVAHKIYKYLSQSETRSDEIRRMISAYKGKSVTFVSDSLRQTVTVSDKDEEQNRTEQNRIEERGTAKAVHTPTGKPMNQARYDRLVASWGPLVDRYIAKAAAWADANGKRYRDFAAVAESWLTRDEEAGKVSRPKPPAKLETIEEKRRRIFEEEA